MLFQLSAQVMFGRGGATNHLQETKAFCFLFGLKKGSPVVAATARIVWSNNCEAIKRPDNMRLRRSQNDYAIFCYSYKIPLGLASKVWYKFLHERNFNTRLRRVDVPLIHYHY